MIGISWNVHYYEYEKEHVYPSMKLVANHKPSAAATSLVQRAAQRYEASMLTLTSRLLIPLYRIRKAPLIGVDASTSRSRAHLDDHICNVPR